MFAHLYDTSVFVLSHTSSHDHILMAKADFTSMTYSWYKNMTCTQIGICTRPAYSRAVYSSNDETIYLVLSENVNTYMFLLNETDGSPLRVFINEFTNVYDAFLLESQTLYISAKNSSTSTNYLFLYHISNASFAEYKFIDTTKSIWDVSYLSTSSRLVFFGDKNSQNVYAMYTLSASMLDFSGLQQETTFVFSEENLANYIFSAHSPSTSTSSATVDDNGNAMTLTSKTMNIGLNESNNVVYFFGTPTVSDYFTLVEGRNETLPINITCSINGDVVLEHTIEDYNNSTAPTWITIDETSSQLILYIPEVTNNTDYYFRIKTNEAGSSVYYYMTVNLTVLN